MYTVKKYIQGNYWSYMAFLQQSKAKAQYEKSYMAHGIIFFTV